jgi:hypothetical protein
VPIAAGLTINPDDLITLPVTMTPRTRGAATGTFQIVASYGSGTVEKLALRVNGNGI